ncbi:MAG: hypothetical protein Q9227_002961 [Pyrenula ochraceoflavens]
MPSRLLDVRPTNKRRTIKLVSTKLMKPEKYAALSYCWGKQNTHFMTTSKSIALLMQGFPSSSLPQTLQDAVQVARNLKIKYLWVDALCIIQDDEVDWHREAAMMTSVYQNAFITIAATCSTSSNSGFLQQRKRTLRFVDTRTDAGNYENLSCGQAFHLRLALRSASEALNNSPLPRRAWTLQEIVLSRRTLHFDFDQLIWECKTKTVSEDDFLNERYLPTFFTLSSQGKGNSWWDWVHDYSGRVLSNPNDRFAAFAGMTIYAEAQLQEECLA